MVLSSMRHNTGMYIMAVAVYDFSSKKRLIWNNITKIVAIYPVRIHIGLG
jgi:hypothetical protein